MNFGALQGSDYLLKYGFILERLYQQSYLNVYNEEHCKSPKCPPYSRVYTAQQYAAGGNHCVITQTTVHTEAPEPPATPRAAQPLIFAGRVICSGI